MNRGLVDEFKAFILRGNVLDLAVAVVIGAAFGAIVTSLVENIITPIIGAIGGQPDFCGGGVRDLSGMLQRNFPGRQPVPELHDLVAGTERARLLSAR